MVCSSYRMLHKKIYLYYIKYCQFVDREVHKLLQRIGRMDRWILVCVIFIHKRKSIIIQLLVCNSSSDDRKAVSGVAVWWKIYESFTIYSVFFDRNLQWMNNSGPARSYSRLGFIMLLLQRDIVKNEKRHFSRKITVKFFSEWILLLNAESERKLCIMYYITRLGILNYPAVIVATRKKAAIGK